MNLKEMLEKNDLDILGHIETRYINLLSMIFLVFVIARDVSLWTRWNALSKMYKNIFNPMSLHTSKIYKKKQLLDGGYR